LHRVKLREGIEKKKVGKKDEGRAGGPRRKVMSKKVGDTRKAAAGED